MGDLGKAQVVVEFTPTLDNVNPDPDTARNDLPLVNLLSQIIQSDEHAPFNIEATAEGENFGAVHPAKRYYQVNNYVAGQSFSAAVPPVNVMWKPVDIIPKNAEVAKLVKKPIPSYPSGDAFPTQYDGQRWRTLSIPRDVAHEDDSEGDKSGGGTTVISTGARSIQANSSTAIWQYDSTPGVVWGVETNLGLADGVPFWLDVDRGVEVALKDQPSFVFISINPTYAGATAGSGGMDVAHIDILLVNNQKPRIFDWANLNRYGEPEASDFAPEAQLSASGGFRLGVLPMLGKIAFFFNGSSFVYSRRTKNTTMSKDSSGNLKVDGETFSLRPFNTKVDTLLVFGTNSTAKINVSAMVFPGGACSLPLYGQINPDTGKQSEAWKNEETMYDINAVRGTRTFGVCSFDFNNKPVASSTSAFGGDPVLKDTCRNGKGHIWVSHYASKNAGDINYVLVMQGTDHGFGNGGGLVKFCGPPFAYRLLAANDPLVVGSSGGGSSGAGGGGGSGGGGGIKSRGGGVASAGLSTLSRGSSAKARGGAGLVNASEDVIAVSETVQTPDRTHTRHSADITLYNEGGRYDSLTDTSYGVRMSMGWSAIGVERVFTGVTQGGYRSEVAGKETITAHCEDYMIVLEHNQMINSPYYDGMVSFDAVYNLASFSGIVPVDDSGSLKYLLPCGYSFTKPAMRFEFPTSIKDCIIEVCRYAQSIAYFDAYGVMHYSPLQGGLLPGTTGLVIPIADFTRDPTKGDTNIILDEKRVEYKLDSATDQIYLRTVDRTSGGVYYRNALSPKRTFPYKKMMSAQMPMLGSWQAAEAWLAIAGQRFFSVPTGINFKTITANIIQPCDYITVDGDKYRVMSLNRQYSADENSLVTTITGEWIGAQ